MTGPHPFLRNLPYGAEIKNKGTNIVTAKTKTNTKKILYSSVIMLNYS